MAGINTLSGIYNQKGDEFLKNLLNNYVIISKQLNGSYFGVSVSEDGKFKFYKKGGEITAIDRILMKFYDRAITQMESVSPAILNTIPENLVFGMEYFNTQDVEEGISMSNCLTLSYIQVISVTDAPKFIHDKEILDKWADKLGINRPPVLFSGHLSDDQKSALLELVYTPAEKLRETFRSKSFTIHLLNILGSQLDESESVDEVIFRFYTDGNDSSDVVLAKLIDPIFAEIISNNDESTKKVPNDYLYLIIIDLMNFIETYSVKDLMSISDKTKSFEENYIALIDKIYIDFINEFKYKYLDVTLQLPEFMRRKEFDLNIELVRSEAVRDMINVSDTFKEIYKILLNFFRKKKNRPTGMFNSNLVMQFNKLIDKLKNVVIGSNMSESYFPSFYEYTGSISEEFDSMSALTVKQRYDKYKKSQKVNIIVDYFQPITNDHINAAKLMYNKNHLPVVFVMLNAKKRNAKLPFQSKTVHRLLQLVKSEYGNMVADIVEINSNTVDSVISALHPKYQPILWGSSKSRMNDYLLQIDFAKNKRVIYNISKNFKLIELPINVNSQHVLDLIRNENYQAYRDYVPKSIYSEFFNLKSDFTDK